MRRAFTLAMAFASFAALGCGPRAEMGSEMDFRNGTAVTEDADAAGAAASEGEAPPAGVERKIIRTAELELVVEDFSKFEQQIQQLVQSTNGYVADFREDRTYGDQSAGHWRVRIPVDRFDAFVEAVSRIGVIQSKQIQAQDVTEEYVDLEAQLTNKRQLEARMLQLLDERTGDLKEVIEVEQQLARVRGEIEQVEGRLRYLSNQVQLTTVAITARESRNYTPPQAPTFRAQIAKTFQTSLDGLIEFGQILVLAIVAAIPWATVGLVLLSPAALFWRRYRKRVT